MSIVEQLSAGHILPIYKPLEWTSFDVVRKMKALLHKEIPKLKIGHAGTLDPLAEGLLIICTQRMTKQVDIIHSYPKTYIATIFLGATTPSYDNETAVDQTFDIAHIDETLIVKTLATFKGIQSQTPPIHSAVKVGGKPAYINARKGKDIEIKSREVEIYDIRLISCELPIITIEATVSKGTYIRTLAKDIGDKLNAGAYLDHLVRTKIGDYTIEDSWRIEDLAENIKLLKTDEGI